MHDANTGKLRWEADAAGVTIFALWTPTDINNGLWHHVVGTYSTATGLAALYVDGAVVASQTGLSTPIPTTAAAFQIGGWGSNTDTFKGSLDEVAVYSYALTAGQVADHAGLRHETMTGSATITYYMRWNQTDAQRSTQFWIGDQLVTLTQNGAPSSLAVNGFSPDQTGLSVQSGATITVDVHDTHGGLWDELQLFRHDAEDNDPLVWKWLSNSQTTLPDAPPYHATVTFVAPTTHTQYDVRLFSPDTGKMATSTVITVGGPTVTLTNPANGATLGAGQLAVITASVGGDGGAANDVDFYVNGNMVGSATTSPWQISWAPPVIGNYNLAARVTNIDGFSAWTAAEVDVTAVASTAGNGATMLVTPVALNLPSKWRSGALALLTPVGNGWTASSSSSWLSLWTTSGTGSTTLWYAAAANADLTARSGTITLTDGVTNTIVNVQQPGDCGDFCVETDSCYADDGGGDGGGGGGGGAGIYDPWCDDAPPGSDDPHCRNRAMFFSARLRSAAFGENAMCTDSSSSTSPDSCGDQSLDNLIALYPQYNAMPVPSCQMFAPKINDVLVTHYFTWLGLVDYPHDDPHPWAMFYQPMLDALDITRERWGDDFEVTSTYRSPEVEVSRHTFGRAFDVKPMSYAGQIIPQATWDLLKAQVPFDPATMWIEPYTYDLRPGKDSRTHVHAQWDR